MFREPQPEIAKGKVSEHKQIRPQQAKTVRAQVAVHEFPKSVREMHEKGMAENRTKTHSVRVGTHAGAPPTPVRVENRPERVVPQVRDAGCRLVNKVPALLAEPLRKVHEGILTLLNTITISDMTKDEPAETLLRIS